MGIRALELAAALSPRFDVKLLAPNDPLESPCREGVEVVTAPPGSAAFHRELKACEAVLVSGHAASDVFLAAPHLPVAVDWYDPYLIENFHYRRLGEEVEANDPGPEPRPRPGDFFPLRLTSNASSMPGCWCSGGRIDALTSARDPEARALLAVVFPSARQRRRARPRPVREVISARPDDPVLFFGGLYDWHDLSPLYAVWPDLLRDFPRLSVVFSENPNRDRTPQRVFESAVATSERHGWKGRSFHFLPWMPYEKRGALYGAATAALALCRPGLETELSFRTRLLDAAAAGLPSVSIHGGALARRLADAGAGWTASDAPGLRRALEPVLRDAAARGRAAECARRFAADLAWPRVAAPLADFFANPRVSSRLPFPETRAASRV